MIINPSIPSPHHPQPLGVLKFCTVYSVCILVPFFCLNIVLRNRVWILALHDSCIGILVLCDLWLCLLVVEYSWVEINNVRNENLEKTMLTSTCWLIWTQNVQKSSKHHAQSFVKLLTSLLKIYHSFPLNFLKVHILAEKLHTDVDNFVRERERAPNHGTTNEEPLCGRHCPCVVRLSVCLPYFVSCIHTGFKLFPKFNEIVPTYLGYRDTDHFHSSIILHKSTFSVYIIRV